MDSIISIIIPVYNAEKHLKKSLESVVNQTYENLQIICVNDGSKDSSWDILSEYACKDSRIEIYKKKNEGVSVARNFALEKAEGDYLLCLDSDDWLEKSACEVALEYMKKYSADVVMWPYIREINGVSKEKEIYSENKVFEKEEVRRKLHRRMIGLYEEELARPENADALCTVWGKLYRRSIIEENNIRFQDIREIGTYEDGLFNLEVFNYVEKVCYINQYLYHYRKDNNASITSQYNPKMQKQWNHLFEIMYTYIENNRLDNTYYVALDNRISLSLIALGINVLLKETSFFKKISMLKIIITQESYVKAISNLELKYLPIHWKMFFIFAKWKCSIGVYALLMVIQKIRGR